MVEKFDPDYLAHGIEINLFHKTCDSEDPGAYDSIVSLLNEAYEVAKEVKPWLPVFPTYQIDHFVDSDEGGGLFRDRPHSLHRMGL